MRRLTLAALALLALAGFPAHAQTRTYASVEQALSRGVEDVCLRAYVLSAHVRQGSVGLDQARENLGAIPGWAPAPPLPDGVVPYINEDETVFIRATLAPGVAGRVYAAVAASAEHPRCDLIALDAPGAADAVIAAFRRELTPITTPVGHDGGVDMFGRRMATSGPDLGVTVYSPVTQQARDRGIGAMVSVGWIPREAIDTGSFDPRRNRQ